MASMTALAVVGGVLSAASTGLSVVGAIQQGQAQKSASNYQAAVMERDAAIQRRNAALVQEQTAAAVSDRREQARRLAGQNRARGGASGVELSGSFLDVETDNLYQSELDVANIQFGGDIDSMNLMESASGKMAGAGFARQQGRSAQRAGYLNAIGAGIGGFSRLATSQMGFYDKGAYGGNRNTQSGVRL